MIHDFLSGYGTLIFGIIMTALLFIVTEVGYRVGRRHLKQEVAAQQREKTSGVIITSMLALLGFMLAISLSMADGQFQARRKLVLEEANAIGTSFLRAGAIGGPHGKAIMGMLREYAELRLDFFAAGEDRQRLRTVYGQTADLQRRIWHQASEITGHAPTPISALLLTSLNQMFDQTNARRWAFEMRVPPYIIGLLLGFSVLSMLMLGYYFGVCGPRHHVLSLILFFAFTAAILLIIDLNRPRNGYIQPEQTPLVWVLDDMKEKLPVKPGAPAGPR